jgi:GNAT superfamily N-acetyltransferase
MDTVTKYEIFELYQISDKTEEEIFGMCEGDDISGNLEYFLEDEEDRGHVKFMCVAKENEKHVGFMCMIPYFFKTYTTCNIDAAFVDSSRRRRGILKAMYGTVVEYMRAWMKKLGRNRIYFRLDPVDERCSQNVWKRMGFVPDTLPKDEGIMKGYDGPGILMRAYDFHITHLLSVQQQ